MPPARKIIDVERMVHLNSIGRTNHEIAEQLGVAPGIIRRRLEELGLRSARLGVMARPEEVRRLHAKGLTNRQIAAELDVSHQLIAKRLKFLGLETNGRTRGVRIVEGGNAQCSRCGLWFPVASYPKLRAGKPDECYQSYCWACKRKQAVKRFNSHVDIYLREKRNRIRQRSDRLGLPFDLSQDYLPRLHNLQRGRCLLTGETMTTAFGKGRNDPHSCSVDKIIPELGYVEGNVVLLTKRINSVKYDLTLDEMKRWMPGWHRKLTRFMDQVTAPEFMQGILEAA